MDKDLAAAMGQAARQARHARQLTQERVAEQIGVSSEFYSRLERGLAHPSLETLLRLTDILGVTVDTLLGLEAGAAPAPPPPFALTSADDPAVVRRLTAELQAAQPSTVRLVRAILGELEDLDAALRRARRARAADQASAASETAAPETAAPATAAAATAAAEPTEDE
jgi:transcriptional regulator with XRE-family HTH domain